MDYEIITVSSYNGDGTTEKAVEVFNPVTGKTISICRRRPYENKEAWIARALDTAARFKDQGR
ncbi:hypothetical protein [Sphingomonas sp.]|uniref:hypothetical protein n=1 Tax=Sphingomonas sp. TaxID=28214 RepID=UPI003B3A4442